jgi:hypothetical protein
MVVVVSIPVLLMETQDARCLNVDCRDPWSLWETPLRTSWSGRSGWPAKPWPRYEGDG